MSWADNYKMQAEHARKTAHMHALQGNESYAKRWTDIAEVYERLEQDARTKGY